MMFVAKVTEQERSFDTKVYVLKKDCQVDKLKDPFNFCSLDEKHECFLAEEDIEITGWSIAESKSKKDATVVFRRPFNMENEKLTKNESKTNNISNNMTKLSKLNLPSHDSDA